MTFHVDSFSQRLRLQANKNFNKMAQAIHEEINRERTNHGLDPLTWDDRIQKIAKEKCREMAKSQITDHEGFKSRAVHLRDVIKESKTIGENVGSNAYISNPEQEMVRGWIESPGHYKNILGNYHLTGIAAHSGPRGKYYFTQIFVRV